MHLRDWRSQSYNKDQQWRLANTVPARATAESNSSAIACWMQSIRCKTQSFGYGRRGSPRSFGPLAQHSPSYDQNSKLSPLLRLTGEIRNRIYANLLDQPVVVEFYFPKHPSLSRKPLFPESTASNYLMSAASCTWRPVGSSTQPQ